MKNNKKIAIAAILLFVIAVCSNVKFDKEKNSEHSVVMTNDIYPDSDDFMTEEGYYEEESSFEMPGSIEDEKVTDADSYDAMDKVRGFRRYDMERIEYQADWQCHFLVYIDKLSSDWEVYRNIDAENMTDEEGQIPLGYQQIAYLADIIVDKYIREYGGADVKYTVYGKYWIIDMFPDTPEGIYYLVITAGDGTELIALWNSTCNVFSVLIEEERETAETKEEEFIKYLECIEEQRIFQAQDNRFQMVRHRNLSGRCRYRRRYGGLEWDKSANKHLTQSTDEISDDFDV